eukprot:scaffold3263_cov110-Amphora_coffeaeformis.AAC.3
MCSRGRLILGRCPALVAPSRLGNQVVYPLCLGTNLAAFSLHCGWLGAIAGGGGSAGFSMEKGTNTIKFKS